MDQTLNKPHEKKTRTIINPEDIFVKLEQVYQAEV